MDKRASVANELGRPCSFPDKADGDYVAAPTATRRGNYTGPVVNHCMNGPGKLETALGVWMGTFMDDELEGDGVYKARETSEGDVSDVADSALTTSFLASVSDYSGSFHCSRFEGPTGTLRFRNGDTYQGPFTNGLPDGAKGKYTYADGRVYEGDMKAGRLHGHGRLTQPNGDYYDGEFVDGAMTGFGTASYANGARVFTGLWEGGKKLKGKLSFPGSERMYDGAWRGERPHGHGTMVFANGDRYEGDFEGGMLQGVGLLMYAGSPERRYYYGQFLQDQPYGRGQLVTYHEHVGDGDDGGAESARPTIAEGYFLKGQLVQPGDTDTVTQVLSATKGLPQPESRPVGLNAAGQTGAMEGEGRADTAAAAAPIDGDVSSPVSGGHAAQPSSSTAATAEAPAPALASVGGSPSNHQRGASAIGDDFDSDLSNTESCDEEDAEGLVANDSIVGSFTPAVTSSLLMDDSCKGWLEKCSIGRSTLGLISNWKRRFFILAAFRGNVCLGYYDDELCRRPIGFLRLSPEDTRIVTRPSSRTHKKATKPGRELCVIYHEHRKAFKLLLRAADTAEHDCWVAAFLRHFTIVDRPTDFPLPVK